LFGRALSGSGRRSPLGWLRTAPEFQEDYEEKHVLNAAARTSQGLSPYPDPHQEPIVFNPYGPVVYYGLGPIISHYGVHFRAARIAVWCAALACALLVAADRRTGHAKLDTVIIVSAPAYLCVAVVTSWIPVLRVDSWSSVHACRHPGLSLVQGPPMAGGDTMGDRHFREVHIRQRACRCVSCAGVAAKVARCVEACRLGRRSWV